MRKDKIMIVLLYICTFFCIVSCKDVFEEDIEDQKVTLIYPKKGDIIDEENITFQWGDNEEIDEFRLRVRNEESLIVVDTLISGLSHITTLPLGEYCWKLRGENSAFKTSFSEENCFSLSAPIDLIDIEIILSTPEDQALTNSDVILFRWDKVENATNYEFRLFSVNNGVEQLVLERLDLTNSTIQLRNEIENDATYRWEVLAVNSGNESKTESQSRSFIKDTEAPSPAILVTPINRQVITLGDTITFSWNIGEANEEIESEIQISRDANFATILSQATTLTKQTQLTPTDQGTYYWRVRGKDKAGNQGNFMTTPFSFQINQPVAPTN